MAEGRLTYHRSETRYLMTGWEERQTETDCLPRWPPARLETQFLSSRPKTNKRGGQGGTGRGLSQRWVTQPNQLYPMISPLCLRGPGPNQKTKTGLMAKNDSSVKGGMGSVGGPDKVFVLPFPHPLPHPPIISWHWGRRKEKRVRRRRKGQNKGTTAREKGQVKMLFL